MWFLSVVTAFYSEVISRLSQKHLSLAPDSEEAGLGAEGPGCGQEERCPRRATGSGPWWD